LKYLRKVADAEKKWQEKALEIEAGKQKSMLTILEERGLVHQITGYAFPWLLNQFHN
jgi:tyrosyl-tRNA synthetase